MKSPSPNRCDYSTVLAIQSLSELLLLLKRRIESTRPATYQFSLLLTAWRRRNCHRPLWRRQGAEAPLLAEGSGHSVSAAALVVRFSDGGSLHHCRSWSSPTSAVSSSRAARRCCSAVPSGRGKFEVSIHTKFVTSPNPAYPCLYGDFL